MSRYRFEAELWLAEVDASWVFATVPPDDADDIAERVPPGPGFGSVRVEVTVGATTWRTSLFPDSKLGSYVLPVKKAVRTAEDLDVGDTADIEVELI